MCSDPSAVDQLLAQPFTIHSINAYTHMGLSGLADYLELRPEHLQKTIRVMHHQLVTRLEAGGIDYAELQNALVPQRGRHEVAFMFDSTRAGSDRYGDALSRAWLPALRDHGPDKTVIRHGDILQLPNEFVWRELERHLVGARDFPRRARELYYVVYLTNLSPGQLRAIDATMKSATAAYLGYVDCSTWTPLKSGMLLPQIGLRLRDTVITGLDDGGTANQVGYPIEEYGFRVLGVDEELHRSLLGHRLDNGVPEWADNDTAIALSVLGGERQPVTSMNVVINESRIDYLRRYHAPPLHDTGLAELDRDALAAAIKDKFANGLIYRIRFVEGSREGVLTPALDAMMFTVQVEFPDRAGTPKRYQVGVKYLTEDHTGEIVTFY